MITTRRLVLIAIAMLGACEGTTARCDPSLSWTSDPPRPDAGHARARVDCVAERCNVVDVAAGARHTCVRTHVFDVFCFGANEHGQSDPARAGEPFVAATRSIRQGEGLDEDAGTPAAGLARWIAAGAAASCAASDDALRCWGHRAVIGGDAPIARVIDGAPVIRPRLAALHGCARTVVITGEERALVTRCFGAWDGRDPSTPAHPPVTIGPSLRLDDVGGFRTCVVDDEVGLACRGGVPPGGVLAPGAWNLPLAPVGGIEAELVQGLAVGPEHACAITRDAIVCWGRGDRGQLGGGDLVDREEPVVVDTDSFGASSICAGGGDRIEESAGGTFAASVAPGFTCTVALGRALCWGANDEGQLGDGTRTDRSTPVVVDLPESVQLITCGAAHACATSRSRAWCWGANDRGQLGVPPSELEASPAPIEVDLLRAE